MSALNCLRVLWSDESGAVLSAELVLILTIGVLSLVVGLGEVANAINCEMFDIARAICSLNQSFATPSFFGCRPKGAWFFGSRFVDIDQCAGFCQRVGAACDVSGTTGYCESIVPGSTVISAPAVIAPPLCAPAPLAVPPAIVHPPVRGPAVDCCPPVKDCATPTPTGEPLKAPIQKVPAPPVPVPQDSPPRNEAPAK